MQINCHFVKYFESIILPFLKFKAVKSTVSFDGDFYQESLGFPLALEKRQKCFQLGKSMGILKFRQKGIFG